MLMRRWVALVSCGLLCLLAGCSASSSTVSSLPDGSSLLHQAAGATRQMNSAHFTVKVNGTVPGLPLTAADGDLTRDGKAKGTATVDEFGQPLQIEFVLVDKALYLEGPTGGFRPVPGGTGLYDPTAILNPNTGAARVLSGITGARTQGKETINGIAAYRVTGEAGKGVVAGLVPGVDSSVEVTVWVRADSTHQLVRALIQLPSDKQGAHSSSVDITLSNANKPVTIAAPALR
ncbi:LppX_LprAFG lipoprotein [Streptomyces sp. RB6PN25]|uniref:LppX_LprAFG lipoprotein n=1 Tax=Streptomyces humicola TaxID=2953240 RepID=A0ABT1PNI2_9ACTN|nr:LppX_LprAFG lipoprotein [Streptomyces humicola]MCQ4079230.1 LppX_LprAFG lipoprotein [Streptomyces humicola]